MGISNAAPAPQSALSDAAGDLLYPDYYWSAGQFTYSIPTASSTWPGYGANTEPFTGYKALTAAQATRFRAAVALWDSYIAPNFTETNDATATGNVRVAFSSYSNLSSVWGYGNTPAYHGGSVLPQNGDIWINADYESATFAAGTYDWEALLHELGHALGLKHSFEAPAVPAQYENRRYTIMSYTDYSDSLQVVFEFNSDGSVKDAVYDTVNPTTPMVLDIAAVQQRYGADTHTATGNTVYSFGQDMPLMQTIYDAGGTDTFDIHTVTRGSTINLTPGSYSSVGYWSAAAQIAYWQAHLPAGDHDFVQQVYDAHAGPIYTWSNNVAIALSTVIENAIGGSGSDKIIGNTAANVLTGGAGSDVLTGGAGADTFRDTLAHSAGDTITDLSAGDRINFTDTAYASFTYQRLGATLNLGGGGSMTLSNKPGGHLITAADASGGVDLMLAAHQAGLNDLTGDGHSDILWQRTTGDLSAWTITGQTALQAHGNASYYAAPGGGWQAQGTMDFSGDGASDLIWRNSTSGQLAIWDATGSGGFSQSSYLSGGAPTNWSLAGFGDFNGDGKDDIFWRDTAGDVSEWQSTGTGFTQNTYFSAVSTAWHIEGIGDFNGDGEADVLWRSGTGALSLWRSTGSGFTQNTYFDSSVGTSWHIAGVADFNGDGKDDILWRNDSGAISQWQSTGSGFAQNTYFDASVGNDWHVSGIFDFNDDGKADILWRNDNGVFSIWESTGSSFNKGVYTDGSVGTDWSIVVHQYDIV